MDGTAHRLLEPDNLIKFNINGSMTCNAVEVAHLLGLSERIFNKRRQELAAAGFPDKLPGVGRWSRPAVVAWISSNGETSVAQPRGVDRGDENIAAVASDLEAEYGRGRAA
jgi:hypothetical protein